MSDKIKNLLDSKSMLGSLSFVNMIGLILTIQLNHSWFNFELFLLLYLVDFVGF